MLRSFQWFPDQGRLIFVDGDWGGWSYDPGSKLGRTCFVPTATMGADFLSIHVFLHQLRRIQQTWVLVFGGGQNIYKMNSSGAVSTIASAPFGNVNVGMDPLVAQSQPIR